MKHYGIVYQGSKSKIAKSIVSALPSGNRLVDLFGGGCAITDCAITEYKHKWKYYVYNDVDTLLTQFIEDCINGRLPKKPRWISREEFKEKKDTDGLIRYCWSFGCSGKAYLYGKDVEQIKHDCFEWVVNDIKSEYIESLFPNIQLVNKDITKRRLELKRITKVSLPSESEATRCQSLERLKITNISYDDYVYKDGDIVYCDIPYEDTASYVAGGFNQEKFVEWALSRDYPVFISSLFNWKYKDRFHLVWGKDINSTLSQKSNSTKQSEVLYCNKDYEKFGYRVQLSLFDFTN